MPLAVEMKKDQLQFCQPVYFSWTLKWLPSEGLQWLVHDVVVRRSTLIWILFALKDSNDSETFSHKHLGNLRVTVLVKEPEQGSAAGEVYSQKLRCFGLKDKYDNMDTFRFQMKVI